MHLTIDRQQEEASLAWRSQLIDGIAREVARDVLYLEITEDANPELIDSQMDDVTNWLDDQGVDWKVAESFDPEDVEFVCIEGGPQCLYIDVGPDSEFSKTLKEKFVNTDGSAKIQGIALKQMSYAVALEHSKRDDPEYWDKFV